MERDSERQKLSQSVASALLERKWVLATAESCTGGGIATLITDLAGSSAYFDRSFVTYSNNAKQTMLDVPQQTLVEFGAVSEQTAKAMAEGAQKNSLADVSLSVTGIAGPTGAVEGKPVGTVCFGLKLSKQSAQTTTQFFDGDRAAVREQSVQFALNWLLQCMKK